MMITQRQPSMPRMVSGTSSQATKAANGTDGNMITSL